MMTFCVECGKQGELIGSLCVDCYSRRHVRPAVPSHVDLTLCAHCSSMRTEHGWEDVGSVREAAELAIERALVLPRGAKLLDLSVQLAERDERNLSAKLRLVLAVEGHEFERELETVVRLKRGSCDECSRQHGGYYEAILQLRGAGRVLDKQTEADAERFVRDRIAAMRRSSREVFVSRVERVRGGVDFYISTVSSARSIARELQEAMCAEYKESSSLWGRRAGRDVYRMTFLVRLPGFARGDIVELEGRDYLVRDMTRGMVRVIDLLTSEEKAVRRGEPIGCTLSIPKARILRAVVLSEGDEEVQVLDPESMSPVDVRKPPGFLRKGEHVRLVKTKLGTYVLSDSW